MAALAALWEEALEALWTASEVRWVALEAQWEEALEALWEEALEVDREDLEAQWEALEVDKEDLVAQWEALELCSERILCPKLRFLNLIDLTLPRWTRPYQNHRSETVSSIFIYKIFNLPLT